MAETTMRNFCSRAAAERLQEKGLWVVAVWMSEDQDWLKIGHTVDRGEAYALFDSTVARHKARSIVLMDPRGPAVVHKFWNLGIRPRNVRPREPRAYGSVRHESMTIKD